MAVMILEHAFPCDATCSQITLSSRVLIICLYIFTYVFSVNSFTIVESKANCVCVCACVGVFVCVLCMIGFSAKWLIQMFLWHYNIQLQLDALSISGFIVGGMVYLLFLKGIHHTHLFKLNVH